MIKTILAWICLACSCMASAVDIHTLNPVEKLSVAYPAFAEPMTFNVTLPASYDTAKDKRYFVLFDLHPRSQHYLSGLHNWLSHNGEWPWLESIIVTPADYHKEFAALYEKTVAHPDDPTLLNFLESDVLASIDKNFRTNGFKIYSGFMSNGATGLYVLLNRPAMFNAYIITSPTLDNNFLGVASNAAKKLPTLTDKMRFLYLTIGQHNYEKAHIEAVESLHKTLSDKAPKDLDWHVVNDDKHYYMSRPVVAALNGIELLFDDYHNNLSPDSAVAQQGVDAVITHYETLSQRKYGFAVSAEDSLKSLARSFLSSDPQRALEIYHKTVSLYPDSAYAYSALAAAYKETGDINKAIEYQTIAVEKSASMIEWHQNNLRKRLTEYAELGEKSSDE